MCQPWHKQQRQHKTMCFLRRITSQEGPLKYLPTEHCPPLEQQNRKEPKMIPKLLGSVPKSGLDLCGVLPFFGLFTPDTNAKTRRFFLETQLAAFDLSENAAFWVLRVSGLSFLFKHKREVCSGGQVFSSVHFVAWRFIRKALSQSRSGTEFWAFSSSPKLK